MTFAQIPAGGNVFLDANTLVYHFANDALYGPACTGLVQRVELRQILGYTSAHALADVAHRLMTLEAISAFGWPAQGIAARLRKHYSEIAKLSVHERALSRIPLLGIQVLPLTEATIMAAGQLTVKHQLLTGDALVVSLMQSHGLTLLASNDSDFDRVSSLTRFAPI